jgi:hypothetical protein
MRSGQSRRPHARHTVDGWTGQRKGPTQEWGVGKQVKRKRRRKKGDEGGRMWAMCESRALELQCDGRAGSLGVEGDQHEDGWWTVMSVVHVWCECTDDEDSEEGKRAELGERRNPSFLPSRSRGEEERVSVKPGRGNGRDHVIRWWAWNRRSDVTSAFNG